jgi:hypothetical protein
VDRVAINHSLIENRYKIDNLIYGEPGYSLYAGKDTRLNRPCMIAQYELRGLVSNPAVILHEVAVQMAKLNHPGLAAHFDHLDSKDKYYLIEEKVAGSSLKAIKANTEFTISIDNVKRWITDICDITAYLHGQGIIHGNLIPDNIIVTSSGRVRLANLSMIWAYKSALGSKLTNERHSEFRAPELNTGPPGVQSDVYSIGAILSFLCANSRSPDEGIIETGSVIRTVSTANAFSNIISRATSPDITQRFKSISELRDAIRITDFNQTKLVDRRDGVSLPAVGGLFQSIRTRYKWVLWIFIAMGLANAVALVFYIVVIRLLDQAKSGDLSQSVLETYSAGEIIINSVQLLLIVASALVFFFWIHRAYKNLTALGGMNLRHSPGWAIGWFFVPIAYLWKPYQVVAEIWRVSHPVTRAFDSKNPPATVPPADLVGWWWAAYIVQSIIGQISFRMSSYAKEYNGAVALMYMSIVDAFVSILGIIITVLMVKKITDFQENKAEMMRKGQTYLVG